MPRGAFKQGHAEAVLHPADLPRDRALGQSGALRGPRERAGLGHELKEGEFVNVKRNRGQELIHKVHQSINYNEFYATLGRWNGAVTDDGQGRWRTRRIGATERIDMPDFTRRLPQGVPGRWYVDANCIDCDLCRRPPPPFSAATTKTATALFFINRRPMRNGGSRKKPWPVVRLRPLATTIRRCQHRHPIPPRRQVRLNE